MIKNVLLTGGTGFLGSNILKELVFNSYNVVVLIRKSSDLSRIQNINGSFKLFCVDDKFDNLFELFELHQIDTIIHTATEYGRNCLSSSILMSNLIFPIKLIEEGLKNGLKYFINSDTFFGKDSFKDSSYLNEYTISKKYFLNHLFSSYPELKVINMRLEHIFGEFDSQNKFVTNIMHQLINEKKEVLLTEGLQKRDFIYVDDVVGAYLKVIININRIKNLTEFEVGRGESISVRHFVQTLLEMSGSKSELKFGALPIKKGEIQDSMANVVKLKEIGWELNYDLRTAISKMIKIEINKNKLIS
jgi:nucleoside-diphosphate-sugar epimerase